GIDDESHGPMSLRLARLDAPEGSPVAGDRDLAADADPERVERPVVLDQPVVDVHRFGGHVAVARVPVERGDLWAACDGVPGHGRLPQFQRDGCRLRPGEEPRGDRVGVREIDEVLLRPRGGLSALVSLAGTIVLGVTRPVGYAVGVFFTPTLAGEKVLAGVVAGGGYPGKPAVFGFFRVRGASLGREGGGGGDDVLDRQR